jgi:hypothetical protein
MKNLQAIINVREIPPACSQWRQRLPSLRDYVSTTPSREEEKILGYLSQGVVCGIYNDRGMLFDVLQPGRRLENLGSGAKRAGSSPPPNLILTDGTWLWPGALWYYVAAYHLQLPATFVQHAEGHQWRIDPAAVRVEELQWDAFDEVPLASENTR